MNIRKKNLKSMINFIVVVFIALIGFIKVKHPFGYFVGVPIFSWIAYLLTNAMCTDLFFGETFAVQKKIFIRKANKTN